MNLLNLLSHELIPLPSQTSGLRQLKTNELNEKEQKRGFFRISLMP